MSMINLNIDANIFLPAFRPYIEDYSNRTEIYWGGRASGKTYFCVLKMLLKGLKEKRFILLMNKLTNKIKDGVWKELRSAIDLFQLTPYFEFNKSEFRATCTLNGTEFRCLGVDESEKIKGYSEISDCYLDEMTSFSQDDFLLINGTLRSTKYKLPLQIIGSFNPVSKMNWVYKYFGFDGSDVPTSTLVHHSTYLDNTRADASEYFDTLKIKNPTRYKIEALGEFATLDKLVYPFFDIGEPPEDCNKLNLICGLDWGFSNDPTAFIAAYEDATNKILYIFDEYYQTGMLNSDIALMIKHKGFAKSVIIADSAEPKSLEEIKKAGVLRIKPSVKGKDSILSGILKLQEYKLVVSPKCENTIIELQNYSWQKDKSTGEYINKPIDEWNHLMDALRYALQTKSGQLRSISITNLGL